LFQNKRFARWIFSAQVSGIHSAIPAPRGDRRRTFSHTGHGHAPLHYDNKLGGCLVNVTRDQLEDAPKYANENDWDWSDSMRRKVYDYYGQAWAH
jgi:hypothetical protein